VVVTEAWRERTFSPRSRTHAPTHTHAHITHTRTHTHERTRTHAHIRRDKEAADISKQEIEEAQNELTTMLANAVREHSTKWWEEHAAAMDKTVVQIKAKEVALPPAAAAPESK
jgi:hypothetical protein